MKDPLQDIKTHAKEQFILRLAEVDIAKDKRFSRWMMPHKDAEEVLKFIFEIIDKAAQATRERDIEIVKSYITKEDAGLTWNKGANTLLREAINEMEVIRNLE